MEDKKHILIDARPLVDPNAGGVRRVAEQVLRALIASDMRADFTFVTTGARERTLPHLFANHPSVTHVHIKWPNKLLSALLTLGVTSIDRLAARELKKRTGKQNSQEQHLQPTTYPLQPVFDGALLLNLGFVGFMEIPYALVLHDLSFLIHPKWFSLKGRLWHYAVNPREIARRADRVFTVSETTARDAERLLDVAKEKIDVFHPGVSKIVPLFHGSIVKSEDGSMQKATPTMEQWNNGAMASRNNGTIPRPYLLAFGASDPRKNVKTAIAAVEQVRKEPGFESLSLILIGSNRGAMEQWNNGTWITRLPSVSDAELASLYENASALLYPSWYEGFGLPLHEAARYGLPCLASAHGALPETAPQGTIFAPPMKPHLWAGMLRDMLSAPDRYRTMFNESLEKPNISPIREWLQIIKRS